MKEMVELETIKKLIQDGKSIREISRATGIDRQTLKYRLNKIGIKSKYKQGSRPKNFKSEHFKGYTTTSYGYKTVKDRDHPNSDRQGYILEHRIVMEKFLGRFLTKEEVIHHRNEIKSDNRIENLFLFPNDELHRCFHMLNKYSLKKLSPEEFMKLVTDGKI